MRIDIPESVDQKLRHILRPGVRQFVISRTVQDGFVEQNENLGDIGVPQQKIFKISRFLQCFADQQHQVMYFLKGFRGRMNNVDLLIILCEKCVTQPVVIIFSAGEGVVLPDVQYVPDIGRVIVLEPR